MDWKNSGESITLPVGQYNIEFKEIDGYTKPANINVDVTKGSTIQRTGTYIQGGIIGIDYCNEGYNSLKVLTNEEDGEWQLTPSSTNPSDFYPDNMYGGVIRCITCPESIGGDWRIKTITDTSFIKGLIEPTTIGGQWRIQGTETWYNHNQSIQFPEGDYIVEFKPISGYSTSPNVKIILNTHETINALGIYIQEG